MGGLVDDFITLAREKFQFLADRFDCRLVATEKHRDSGSVIYQNSTTAVGIYYDVRDGVAWVVLMRLVRENAPAYGDPVNSHGLWTILRHRAPSVMPAEAVRTRAEMEQILTKDAAAVEAYAPDVLNGDFSIFPELARIEARDTRPGPPEQRADVVSMQRIEEEGRRRGLQAGEQADNPPPE